MTNLELLNKIKNPKITSTASSLRDFISGSIHQDFENEIVARVEQMRDFNEECSSKEYLETRGGIKALRMCINIFKEMLENKLDDLEESE